MNFYPFHLGDYASHTAHLEPMEDLAYRRMLDLYYLREGPLPANADEVARLIRMRSEVDAVSCVLNEFFTLADDGWRHARCDEEIAKMQDKRAKARASAQASVSARKANVERTLNERSTEAELPIPTPIPIPTPGEKHKARSAKRACQLPPDFEPDETARNLAAELKVSIEAQLPKFMDYHTARGKPMKDWQAAFRTWLRNANEWKRPGKPAQKEHWMVEMFNERRNGGVIDADAKVLD